MEVDIQRLEHLNNLFSQVVGSIFLGTRSSEALNEMTVIQKRILRILGLSGPQKMSDIAKMVSVSTASATGVIDKMVRSALVERKNDPSDRRIVRVSLLEKGRKTLREHARLRKQRLKELLGNLEPAQQRDLVHAFERIYELLGAIGTAQEEKRVSGEG